MRERIDQRFEPGRYLEAQLRRHERICYGIAAVCIVAAILLLKVMG